MTQIMGILNLTPDSFSADGTLLPAQALERIDAMINDGAHIIDIGAESTRPGATPLKPQDEWQRIAPVAEALMERKGQALFSIDTRHAEVARKAIAAGFDWINDVSGGADPHMLECVRETGCVYVAMHSLGVPADSARVLAAECDPVKEICVWAERFIAGVEAKGASPAQIILDPGIGFGKTPAQSLALVKRVGELKAPGVPVLVGHSRKSFLSVFTDRPASLRDPETLAVSCYLASQNVDYIRVHDVKSHAAMLRMKAAL